MRYARRLRQGTLILLASGWVGASTGCIQRNYYSPVPVCASPVGSTTIQYGAVCEVPPPPGAGSTVVQAPGTTVVAGPPQLLVSQPRGEGLLGSRSWRRSDDAPLATTRIEGSLDGDTLSR